MTQRKTSTWLALAALTALASSAGAAWILLARPTIPVVPGLWRVAEAFTLPGELLWFATLGGVFAGPPSDVAGIALLVLGTAAFWFLAVAAVVWLARRVFGRRP